MTHLTDVSFWNENRKNKKKKIKNQRKNCTYDELSLSQVMSMIISALENLPANTTSSKVTITLQGIFL
jgi:hypothetical protein